MGQQMIDDRRGVCRLPSGGNVNLKITMPIPVPIPKRASRPIAPSLRKSFKNISLDRQQPFDLNGS